MAHQPAPRLSPILLEDNEGIVLWRPADIAALTPDVKRWRAVSCRGEVAHLPEAPAGEWRQLDSSLVRPEHLRRLSSGEWQDPAGWTYSPGELEPLPAPEPAPPVDGHPTDSLLALRKSGKSWEWLTEGGTVPCGLSWTEAVNLHPDLLIVHERLAVNVARLRRWESVHSDSIYLLHMDDGQTEIRVDHPAIKRLCSQLSLHDLEHLDFAVPELQHWHLRDFPAELARCSAEQLKAWFRTPRDLVANLLWQTVRYRQQGLDPEYGREHRGYWYDPVYPTLYRAGFAPSKEFSRSNRMLELYREVTETMVGRDRVFTYAELGFSDPGGRSLGDRLPHVVLLTEKDSLRDYARRLQAELGVSYLISSGTSKLLDVEYLVRDLRHLGILSVRVIGYVDFDPGGWVALEAFVTHLDRYGVSLSAEPSHLVLPSCFSAEEIELYALPCPTSTPNLAALAQRWVQQSGGINGKARGIHANHLKPCERVLARMRELL